MNPKLLVFLVLSYANLFAGDRVFMISEGASMLPTLPVYARIVVEAVPFDNVKIDSVDGDIIATRLSGMVIVHRAVAKLDDGSIVTRGDNNAHADAISTAKANYIGIVRGYEDVKRVGELIVPAFCLKPISSGDHGFYLGSHGVQLKTDLIIPSRK